MRCIFESNPASAVETLVRVWLPHCAMMLFLGEAFPYATENIRMGIMRIPGLQIYSTIRYVIVFFSLLILLWFDKRS